MIIELSVCACVLTAVLVSIAIVLAFNFVALYCIYYMVPEVHNGATETHWAKWISQSG